VSTRGLLREFDGVRRAQNQEIKGRRPGRKVGGDEGEAALFSN